ncbi:MAG: hypothetical protein KME54_00800 [Tolypothrix brevis GSE-NOS-MK-07-07A]|nr:hypothetical protein [Tolypothrix brevis GSE-NOS-MK-07-07A]
MQFSRDVPAERLSGGTSLLSGGTSLRWNVSPAERLSGGTSLRWNVSPAERLSGGTSLRWNVSTKTFHRNVSTRVTSVQDV